ncbi:MAG: 50S ribosomal protein L20 [Bdellovibrionaceae bacterium]|nr:50S ribosomal protein L20 [Pseudobdellovibrionaceae bacterium]
MRVKRGFVARRRRNKVLDRAKGYRGSNSNCYITAVEKNDKAMQYAYRDRKVRKRDFRGLWIQRINAAARLNGVTYSQLINGLKIAGIDINRKMLAEVAVADSNAFAALVKQAQA